MTKMSAPMNSTDKMPPRLSTGSVVSLTRLGTHMTANTMATTASGKVARNTEPHEKCSNRKPATNGPHAVMAPPRPDQSAIDLVRPDPDQSAVISASTEGAKAANRDVGMASAVPMSSINLRP
jgi:hypothetical protein